MTYLVFYYHQQFIQLALHLYGHKQTMDPRSMDHLCGSSPWTSSWTRSIDYPVDHPQFLKMNFTREVLTNNEQSCGQFLLSEFNGILLFYTSSIFFCNNRTIPSCEGVTIFEGNRRSGVEKVFYYAALFFMKIETKMTAYETAEEAWCLWVCNASILNLNEGQFTWR